MKDEKNAFHRNMAVEAFNSTWDLLEKDGRTPGEDLQMIHVAHVSRYHWGVVGTTLEWARGEWQISRVYSVLGHGEEALYHGEKSLQYCKEGNHGGFDLVFAYEALARACAVLSEKEEMETWLSLAMEAVKDVKKKEDEEYVLRELQTISV